MAKDSNELRFVLPLIGACLAAVIIFHVVYWPEFKILFQKDVLFIVFYLLGVAVFCAFAGATYAKRNEGEPNLKRWITLWAAAFVCIWIGTWCSQYRADKSDGIEYKYTK